ncbi:hypothetical protein D3C74_442670 [compost metagenome]
MFVAELNQFRPIDVIGISFYIHQDICELIQLEISQISNPIQHDGFLIEVTAELDEKILIVQNMTRITEHLSCTSTR